ncbi:RNA-directed DNA polymerase from mobile element jockey, partial [Nephila pilipes]
MCGNPLINDLNELDKAVDNFALSIQTAINQSSKAKIIEHPYFNIPFPTRLKIRSKNRLRKIWQNTRYPPIKNEINRLQREIKREIYQVKNEAWEARLQTSNTEDLSLYKLDKTTKNTLFTIPPLIGPRGLVFDSQAKADLFADSLENSFQENAEFYDDDFIEKVERNIIRFQNNQNSPATPKLTSPQEVMDIIEKLNNKKSPG